MKHPSSVECNTISNENQSPIKKIDMPLSTKEGIKYHYSPHSSLSVDKDSSSNKPQGPVVLFCNGFRSSMNGTKAILLEQHCISKGIPFCRFDYRGHGQSDPASFLDMTLSDWIHDAETILTNVLIQEHDKVLLVGSSMGAWISVHLALRNPQTVAGFVGIATAVDFTQHSLYDKATDAQREDWTTKGIAHFPSEYESDPYPITWQLIQDAKEKWLLMDNDASSHQNIAIHCPIHLLHGQCDNDTSWKVSLKLTELVATDDVILTLIKSGDHRLSRPQDIRRILAAVDEMLHCLP
jgi:pimeloyl-ACP methyl ester carboxylesterase